MVRRNLALVESQRNAAERKLKATDSLFARRLDVLRKLHAEQLMRIGALQQQHAAELQGNARKFKVLQHQHALELAGNASLSAQLCVKRSDLLLQIELSRRAREETEKLTLRLQLVDKELVDARAELAVRNHAVTQLTSRLAASDQNVAALTSFKLPSTLDDRVAFIA